MTESGEKYMRSPLTGQWYKVTKWENVEGKPGRHIAKEKKLVDPEEVPDKIREELEEVTSE